MLMPGMSSWDLKYQTLLVSKNGVSPTMSKGRWKGPATAHRILVILTSNTYLCHFELCRTRRVSMLVLHTAQCHFVCDNLWNTLHNMMNYLRSKQASRPDPLKAKSTRIEKQPRPKRAATNFRHGIGALSVSRSSATTSGILFTI